MKYLLIFMSLFICISLVGIIPISESFFYSFDSFFSILDNVGSNVRTTFDGVLQLFGIKDSEDSQFKAYFYLRSEQDDDLIPKSNEFYDVLTFAVVFPKSNFITSQFNRKIVVSKDYYLSYIVLYFGNDGKFLFGSGSDGYSPYKDNFGMSVSQWQLIFGGTYFDVVNNIAYIRAPGLDLDYEYKFEAHTFNLGIWS